MTRMEKNSGGFKCCSILWSNWSCSGLYVVKIFKYV
jgi:hypothetical protein